MTDHLAFSLFHSRVVLSKHQVNPIMVFLGFSVRNRGVPLAGNAHTLHFLRPGAFSGLISAYTMDPLRSAGQDSRYASKY